MSSLTNINNNSAVVNVGRTTPVSPGQQPAAKSIPVVLATDQTPVPVEEQNKIQSEVALSLLGIPRSEVALGIFADVNTYDVNPLEWSSEPLDYRKKNNDGWGISHQPTEAGALVEAPKDEVAILTSKRFFRYQPGRVSAATFGVKTSVTSYPTTIAKTDPIDRNPAVKKYGIFDKFDGYYWENKGDGQEDNFCVVRRTQSLLNYVPVKFSASATVDPKQQQDYRFAGKAATVIDVEYNQYPTVVELLKDHRYKLIDNAYSQAASDPTNGTYFSNLSDALKVKCYRDLDLALDAYILDYQWGGKAHTVVNASTYDFANLSDQDKEAFLHDILIDNIKTYLLSKGAVSAAANKIDTLGAITVGAVGGTAPVDQTAITAAFTETEDGVLRHRRSRIATVFAIYDKFIGYLASEYTMNTLSSGVLQNTVTLYGTYDVNSLYTQDELKFRCIRDIKYIVQGYARDADGGGNAATMYNATNFYFKYGNRVNNLQVYSQISNNRTEEIYRHTFIRRLLTGLNADGTSVSSTFAIPTSGGKSWTPVVDKFGITEYRDQLNTLSTLIINNFSTEQIQKVDFGKKAQYGDLVIYRDNLILVHAAVNDPSLLKPKKRIPIKVNAAADTLEIGEGSLVDGQYITYDGFVKEGSGDADDNIGLVAGKIYRVKRVSGVKSNIVTLTDPLSDSDTTIAINAQTVETTKHYVITVVPFIFPDVYQLGTGGTSWTNPRGMFPYKYTESGVLPRNDANDQFVGYIDTARDPTGEADLESLKGEIDEVNYLWNNWIKQNVDPKYYAVYEYRVPRSRFSQDQLNGAPSDRYPNANKVVYSDVATGLNDEGTVYSGQQVIVDDEWLTNDSLWNYDFTKVTMLKIEFSWYGAVGALFLAYVPAGNGEARWVRVHHLRCSNQLKIPSLGNATLPITYLVYGGGTNELQLGIEDSNDKSYGSGSQHIVKYGASYYIDGGDRGTVRLYSYSNDIPVDTFGSKYYLTGANLNYTSTSPLGLPFIAMPNATSSIGGDATTVVNIPSDKTYFMFAKVRTNSPQDQNVEVIWVSGNNIYLNKTLTDTSEVTLIVARPAIAFGLKAKEEILNASGVGVRNRVQVYPTKLSTANLGSTPVKLKVLKTPYFQPNTTPTNGVTFTFESSYTITSDNLAIPPTNGSLTYLTTEGDFLYGWIRAELGSPTQVGTIFGRLLYTGGQYYFTLLETYGVAVKIPAGAVFLKEGRFTPRNENVTVNSEFSSTKERLSSVFISNQIQCPVPKTGTEIVAFFLKSGSDQFDLLSYFDYNKDYLSYPLTNQIESLYLAIETSDNVRTSTAAGQPAGRNVPLATSINASLTWEEQ